MSPKLSGCYQLDKSNLTKPGLHLVISTRKKTDPKKPPKYLLSKENGQFRYISSLFPFEPESGLNEAKKAFSFDFEGKNYLLFILLDESQAVVKELDTKAQILKSNNIQYLHK